MSILSEKVTWKFLGQLISGLNIVYYFLSLIGLFLELETGRHFSTLPFHTRPIGWRIDLTLFWLVIWLILYKSTGGIFFRRSKTSKKT
jgi:hypothetical protein